VETVVTTITSGMLDGTVPGTLMPPSRQMGDALLAVDLAAVPVAVGGARAVLAIPGNAMQAGGENRPVLLSAFPAGPGKPTACAAPSIEDAAMERFPQIVSVAALGNARVVTFTREPAALVIWNAASSTSWGVQRESTVTLEGDARVDTGHDLFHQRAGLPIACASCHPEGGDDGLVWRIDDRSLRTPSLRGTIAGTAPYHWEGTEGTLSALVEDVYSSRMGGGALVPPEKVGLGRWLEHVPRPAAPPALDAAAADRGKALFEGAAGCTTCHSGPMMTNNATLSVGTAAPLQVPSLVGVGARAPFLHDGCASTLEMRFDPKCRSTSHGVALDAPQIQDLVTYLETL
jgi:mono/diheme cytochrome c family protein